MKRRRIPSLAEMVEHILGGEEHTPDTLENLNSKITDADVIDVHDMITTKISETVQINDADVVENATTNWTVVKSWKINGILEDFDIDFDVLADGAYPDGDKHYHRVRVTLNEEVLFEKQYKGTDDDTLWMTSQGQEVTGVEGSMSNILKIEVKTDEPAEIEQGEANVKVRNLEVMYDVILRDYETEEL